MNTISLSNLIDVSGNIGAALLYRSKVKTNSPVFSSVVVWPDGRCEVTYRKIHLFDIALEGQAAVRESDVFSHGPQPSTSPRKASWAHLRMR